MVFFAIGSTIIEMLLLQDKGKLKKLIHIFRIKNSTSLIKFSIISVSLEIFLLFIIERRLSGKNAIFYILCIVISFTIQFAKSAKGELREQ
jgi:hypothetical protein